MSLIHFSPERCVGCGACVGVCLDEQDNLPVTAPPLRRLVCVETPERVTWYSVGCLHCDDPACVGACPKGCISRDEATGLVGLDTAACIGCGACARKCPHGAVVIEGRKAHKCTGCAGGTPRCVTACPSRALTFTPQTP